MGMRIFCPDEDQAVPRDVVLELACDGEHGLFPPAPARFAGPGWLNDYAMTAGWKTTFRDGERVWLGPCCSGKVSRETRNNGE